MRSTPACAAALALCLCATAHAHIQLLSPTPRYLDLKYGPCGKGPGKDARTTNVHTFEAGQALTVRFKETVPHPGHFRIAFDDDGQDVFQNPASFDDVAPRSWVIKDDIKDKDGTQEYSVDITLPDVECGNCTLQVIQVMTDKPPYNPDFVMGDDLYYQCADLVLRRTQRQDMAGPADMASPPPADLAAPPADLSAPPMDKGGCSAAPSSAPAPMGGLALLALAGLLLLRRRA